MRTLHATESHSATFPHRDLEGAVAAQVRSRMASKNGRSNGSFHRVHACSAGGPRFDSRLRRNILRCSLQRMLMALVKPLHNLVSLEYVRMYFLCRCYRQQKVLFIL
jgi:hypothetical protein